MLPLSPKNNFGSLKTEKLNNKKTDLEIKIITKNNLRFSLFTKKYKINITEIDEKAKTPSNPSK